MMQLFHSHKLHEQQGFTLVEMLIYMNLLSILLLFVSRIFITTLDVQVRSQSTSSVQTDDQYLLSRLQYDIYRAESITIPVNIGSTANSLVLQINGVTYTYAISGTQLQLTTNTGTVNVNSSRTTISDFQAEKQGNIDGVPIVSIHYRLQSMFSEDGSPEERVTDIVLGNR